MAKCNPTPNSTYEQLKAKGHQPDKELGARTTCVFEEERAKYTLEGIDKRWVSFTIDGGVIKDRNTKKCDYLLLIELDASPSNPQWAQIFVELKGKNVKEACEQLETTIQNPLFQHPSNVKRCVRIASSGTIPRNNSDTKFEMAKKRLRKLGYHVKVTRDPESFKTLLQDS